MIWRESLVLFDQLRIGILGPVSTTSTTTPDTQGQIEDGSDHKRPCYVCQVTNILTAAYHNIARAVSNFVSIKTGLFSCNLRKRPQIFGYFGARLISLGGALSKQVFDDGS